MKVNKFIKKNKYFKIFFVIFNKRILTNTTEKKYFFLRYHKDDMVYDLYELTYLIYNHIY
jgi:hypothetical protein